MKYGKVERVMDRYNILVRDLFKKETSQEVYLNKQVELILNSSK